MTAATATGILCAAEARYIGMVTADGSFWVDNAGVSNHATVFEGSIVVTEEASAKLQTASGARILLEARSRAQVYDDRLMLEKGRAQFDSGSGYRIEARTLRISLASSESRAVIASREPGAIEVAALKGEVQVKNARGTLVAQVDSSRSLELRPDQGGASILTGCVSKIGKAYVLRDEVSGVTVELHGAEIGRQMGNRIKLTGTAAASRATAPLDQVIEASDIKVLGTGCGATIAATAKAAAAKGSRARVAPQAGGTGSIAAAGSVVPAAVIAGVGVAAAAGTVAGVVASQQNHKPPISRGR